MKNKYNIEIKSPMGLKKGTVFLEEKEGEFRGKMVCLGKECDLKVQLVNQEQVEIYGEIIIPLLDEKLEVVGTINSDKIKGSVLRKNRSYEFYEIGYPK